MRLRQSLVALLSVAVGCGGSDPLATPSGFQGEAAAAQCQRAVKCGLIGKSEQARCKAAAIAQGSDGQRVFFNLDEAVKGGRVTWDAAVAKLCLDALGAAACGLVGPPKECAGLSTGLVADGAACTASVECVSTHCSAPLGCMGTCDANVGCDACKPETFCDFRRNTCKPRLDVNAACPVGNECKEGLTCVSAVCLAQPAQGEDCLNTFGSANCPPELYCDVSGGQPGKCQPRIAVGGDCKEIGLCADGLTCVGIKIGTSTTPGKCQPWFDAGLMCDATTIGTASSGCPLDMKCEGATCQPTLLPAGSDCNTSGSGCDAESFCNVSTMKCARRVPSGAPCDPALTGQCLSGSCNPTSNTCAVICP